MQLRWELDPDEVSNLCNELVRSENDASICMFPCDFPGLGMTISLSFADGWHYQYLVSELP
jgi:hypothetical protein